MLQHDLLKHFTYTTKELDEMLEIVKLRNDAGQEYFKGWVELNQRKDKLFQAGDPSKWEIDFKDVVLSPEEVAKNRKIAKTLMLPSVRGIHTANTKPQADAESIWLLELPNA